MYLFYTMFIDTAKIFIKSGKGGDGCVSFRRELFVPNGGPDGGDGGKGGDVILAIDKGLNTLECFRHKTKYIAEAGVNGSNGRCKGADGKNIIIKVPEGTVVKDSETKKIIVDMTGSNDNYTILKGGKGGAGNQHFVTSVMQVPRYAKPGESSKEIYVDLELKLLADVSLVGFPNVGKSTIISSVSNAKPQIANYHFTTINPHLGVVNLKGIDSFVIADIPGIIEGASEGQGLGLKFLKHIERTKIILHVVDVSGSEGRNPLEDIKIINSELKKYNINTTPNNMVFALNKIDIISNEELINITSEIKNQFPNYKIFCISAATKNNVNDLMKYLSEKLLKESKDLTIFDKEIDLDEKFKKHDEEVLINKINDHTYSISGEKIKKMLGYTNLDTEKGFDFLQKFLEKEGIIKTLKLKGLQDGDEVDVLGNKFEYYE